jgi:hypothetical protein
LSTLESDKAWRKEFSKAMRQQIWQEVKDNPMGQIGWPIIIGIVTIQILF